MRGTETLVLVESPAQLLNAREWLAATPDIAAEVVVLAPRSPETRRQLRATLDLVGLRRVRWCEARDRVRGPVGLATTVLPQVRTARRLVLGDPFSGLMQTLLAAFTGTAAVVVDDGTATIEFAARLERGEPMLRWHAAGAGPVRRSRAALTTRRLRSRPLELFTAMPLDEVALRVRGNGYRWLRGRAPAPAVREGTVLVGSSLVETGVVGREHYLRAVADVVAARSVRRYLAHRREDEEKLARIGGLGVRVERPALPLEVELARGPVERRVLSFPSTVLYTLPVVLAGSGVEVEAIEVPAGWLTPGPRARDAHGFLDRVRQRRA